jgi:hypothetical protein
VDVIARDLAEQRVLGQQDGRRIRELRQRRGQVLERGSGHEQRAHREATALEQTPHHVAALRHEATLLLEQTPLAQVAVHRDARVVDCFDRAGHRAGD